MSVTAQRMVKRARQVRIRDLNPQLVCVLCGGYFIDATTITECLHSFCKTCIVQFLETNKYCPICDVLIHKTRPLASIRPDQTLQDLVYKLVPGLFTEEVRRRKKYLTQTGPAAVGLGLEAGGSPSSLDDEKISLSLEFSQDGLPVSDEKPSNQEVPRKRYLLCPAAFTIGHLKKFIRTKLDLELRYEIDVFHREEEWLSDQYTLMDIAYRYEWKRRAPFALFFSIWEIENRKRRLEPVPEEDERNVSPHKRTGDQIIPAKVARASGGAERVSAEKRTTSSAQKSAEPSVRRSLPGETLKTTPGTVVSPGRKNTSAATTQTVPVKPVDAPVKRKVGRPPKNPKTPAAPKPPPKPPKQQVTKKPNLPHLMKLSSSQAKQISSNAKSPVIQSKPSPLIPPVRSPPPPSPQQTEVAVSLSLSRAASAAPTQQQLVTSSAGNKSLSPPRGPLTLKKVEPKPKCINTISDKLLAARVTEASPSQPSVPCNKQIVTSPKLAPGSQSTLPMSPGSPARAGHPGNPLSPGRKTVVPPSSRVTPTKAVKSCSSSTQTSTPSKPATPNKPTVTTVSVATSPIASRSPPHWRNDANKSAEKQNALSPTRPAAVPPSPNKNFYREILGVKPKVTNSPSQMPSSQLSPSKPKSTTSVTRTQAVEAEKREAAAEGQTAPSAQPPSAHRPHIAAAVAPTPPKRPYLPVASSAASSQTSTSLRAKPTSPGAGGGSSLEGGAKTPTGEIRSSGTLQVKSEVKDKKGAGNTNADQEAPLDLGTRKSVSAK